jgi:hypothetical protein
MMFSRFRFQVYGKGVGPSDKFGEVGYVALPPCLWGSASDGLEEPFDISNITLRVVKRANATYGHHGEMAHGEIYYVDTPRLGSGGSSKGSGFKVI